MSNILTVRTLKKNLFKFIESLPDDIKNYIYKEFFELDLKYNIINIHFTEKCGDLKRESTQILSRYVKIVLNNEKLRYLFLKRSKDFSEIYKTKTNNKVIFESINKGYYYDFALAWIWRHYH
jgi:hypothetical protein